MTHRKTASRMGSIFIVVFFALLLTACGGSSATSSSSASSTPAATATPSPTAGPTFQQFTNANFTLNYPSDWQTSQGSAAAGWPVYSFADPSQSEASFHVELNAIYFDADSPIHDLFGAQADNGTNCKAGDTSLPATVVVNGKTWNQSDMVCQIAGAAFEIHMYTSPDSTNHGPVVAYGAYQTSTSTATFASLSKEIFDPMFQSLQIK